MVFTWLWSSPGCGLHLVVVYTWLWSTPGCGLLAHNAETVVCLYIPPGDMEGCFRYLLAASVFPGGLLAHNAETVVCLYIRPGGMHAWFRYLLAGSLFPGLC